MEAFCFTDHVPLRKTRAQREAELAELDRKDREHAARLATVEMDPSPPTDALRLGIASLALLIAAAVLVALLV